MIPLLAISTATLVAFVSYLVSLCKYFYISPFVTAWAMATKRVDKIIDFLLAGIAIFFKPVLTESQQKSQSSLVVEMNAVKWR